MQDVFHKVIEINYEVQTNDTPLTQMQTLRFNTNAPTFSQ